MENKKSFVENELSMALERADNNIDKVLYNYDEAKVSETVFVIYKNGYKKEINVAGDSKIAIMLDVSIICCKEVSQKWKMCFVQAIVQAVQQDQFVVLCTELYV